MGFPAGCPYSTECSGASTNCCFRADGTSPYDADGDGYMDCNSPCGAWVAACSQNTPFPAPCDCNDANPNIYPGNGCPL
jgi:hypothetical protein